jgi:glyoxylase-like metal-dependent hydrolase (beta-lactamase superfamily II)
MVTKLKYGNTNTYFIRGAKGSILLDTDYAGTLQMFYKEIKKNGIALKDITYILATHYHPDHMGLVGELVNMGVKFLVMDTQVPNLHFSDEIFSRDKALRFLPSVPEDKAEVIACKDSRAFLAALGIEGEIVSTPSHSEDSITLVLDNGDCFVGDLEPMEFMDGYEENKALQSDWEKVMSFSPKVIHYGHAPKKVL